MINESQVIMKNTICNHTILFITLLLPNMSQRKTLSKVPLTPQFTTNGLSYPDVVKFDNNNFYFVNHDAPKKQNNYNEN
jgi:hypothetical protein